MLTVILETYDGERYQLPMLVEWDLTHTGSVPCDSMAATCLYDQGMSDVLPRATRFAARSGGAALPRGGGGAAVVCEGGGGGAVWGGVSVFATPPQAGRRDKRRKFAGPQARRISAGRIQFARG